MRLKIALVAMVLLVIAACGFLIYSAGRSHDASPLVSGGPYEGFFSDFKRSCSVHEAEGESISTYRNAPAGIAFDYGPDMVLCEQSSQSDDGRSSYTVTAYTKKDYASDDGGTGPLIILHIDNADLAMLPAPVSVGEVEAEIAGQTVTGQIVRPPDCRSAACPSAKLYQITIADHQIVLEERSEAARIITSSLRAI